MNFIALFFILRLIFVTFIPSQNLVFFNDQGILRNLDIYSFIIALELVAGLASRDMSFKRIKELLLLTILIFLTPLFTMFVVAEFMDPIPLNEIAELLIPVTDFLFFIGTIYFSFSMAFDFYKSGRSKFELNLFALSTIILGILAIQISQNNTLFNFIHTLPFLWISYRFRPLKKD
jgi:hypothetical protein